MSGHAGTVPMPMRRDAAAAAAEIVLYVEKRCSTAPTLVGTVGRLSVPNGAINVIPGRCDLSLDIRAGDDATRDAAVADVLAEIERIARRRNVTTEIKEIQRGPAVPCSPRLAGAVRCARWSAPASGRSHLPSGAGHDAVMFSGVTDVGMLFVRCGNGGISHSPLETITAADADLAARILHRHDHELRAQPMTVDETVARSHRRFHRRAILRARPNFSPNWSRCRATIRPAIAPPMRARAQATARRTRLQGRGACGAARPPSRRSA